LSLFSDVVDTPLRSNKSSDGHASHVIANTSDNFESSVDAFPCSYHQIGR
jgi:hypothetical protein